MRTIASCGFNIVGSGTRSIPTIVFPCQQSAFTEASRNSLIARHAGLTANGVYALRLARLRDRFFAWAFAEHNSFRLATEATVPGRLSCGCGDLAGFHQLLEVPQALSHDLLRPPPHQGRQRTRDGSR